jgi:hypothetical protein
MADHLPTPAVATSPARTRRSLLPWLSLLGIIFLAFVGGAAVMFFEQPPSAYLSQAFIGFRAWNEQRQTAAPVPDELAPAAAMPKIDKPGATFDGFTLFAREDRSDPAGFATQAYLINMREEQVHKWAVPFSKVWSQAPHIPGPVQDRGVCFFACHLDPNGDLIVVFHGDGHAVEGFGLAKLDKDSNVLWKYPACAHHDVDVGDDGTIYAIKQEMVDALPRGLEFIPPPCMVDYLVQLSPDGKELREPLSVLEAFRDSPYALLLTPAGRSSKRDISPGLTAPRFLNDIKSGDILHTNSVHVLRREIASQFPGFKPGQVLVSIRHLDVIALVDLDKRAVVWAARGPWRAQHDAQFLGNGHLLIFDNLGLPQTSRVLEYDPRTQSFPWSYPGPGGASFLSRARGLCQRLPNDNTLIVDSQDGQVFEVTHGGEVVWTFSAGRFVSTARRYAPEQVQFLKGGQRARP